MGCIYAQKRTFANRYGLVKQNSLTPVGELGGWGGSGRVSPPPPAKRKNNYYFVSVAYDESKRKTGVNLHLEVEKTLICIFHFQNGKS
jgi:hypothetical protein